MSDAADAAPPDRLFDTRLARTGRGRAVLHDRSVALSRAARNLLLVIEPGHSGRHWLGLVRGATAQDLQTLIDEQLVAPVAAAGGPARPAAAAAPAPRIPLSQALERLGFSQLSDRLTAEARPQLGLINGYRLVLAIERASDVATLRTLALDLVEQVRQARGDAAAQALAQTLADGRPPG